MILDLMVTKAHELISDIKIGGSLGWSDHALVEFAVLRDMGQAKSTVRTLNFRKAKFQLFKELVNRTPWEAALRDKGAEQSWQIFKDAFQRAQKLSIPSYKKSGKDGKRLAWMSQDLSRRSNWLVKQARRKCIGSGSRDRYPGKSIGMLPGYVGIGSGRPRWS